MIKYLAYQESATGWYMVEVFNGVESGGFLSQQWLDVNELRHDMELLGIEPVFPPEVGR